MAGDNKRAQRLRRLLVAQRDHIRELQQSVQMKTDQSRAQAELIEQLFRKLVLVSQPAPEADMATGGSIECRLEPQIEPLLKPMAIVDPMPELMAVLGDRAGQYFANDDDAEPLAPLPGYWNYSGKSETSFARGVGMFGADPRNVSHIVHQIAIEDRGARPVFFIDRPETQIFRDYGFSFEYLPPSAGSGPEDDDSTDLEAWSQDRYRFLLQKWGIREVWHFGDRMLP